MTPSAFSVQGRVSPPLCIVQARMGSSRLPGKVLLPVRGVPLIQRVWTQACKAFGVDNVVVAMPFSYENDRLARFLAELGARYYEWAGPEDDVLSRFAACVSASRYASDDVIVRVCADNPFLDPHKLELTARGAQFSRREGGEAFLLYDLMTAQRNTPADDPRREHVTQAMSGRPPVPKAPARCWTIDTQEDLDRCNALKTYVVDIDGTLCDSLGYPAPSTPNIAMIERLNGLYDLGHLVVIDTARAAHLESITRDQLATWGVRYDELRCGVKIPADCYVDDLSLRPSELFLATP